MQAVVHRWHERGRQGCGQPEHWLRRLHHHLRRWVVARVLSHWPKRQHDWHFGLYAWPRRQDLPGAHLWRLDRQGQRYGLLHQVQTPCSHKRRCPSGCHSIWDERPSGGLSRSRYVSRTTGPPSAVSTGTVVRSSARSGRHRAQIDLIRCPRPVIKRRTVTVSVGGAGRHAGLAGDGSSIRREAVAGEEHAQRAAHRGGAVHGRDRHATVAARTSIAIPVSRSETSHSAAIALSMPSLRKIGLCTRGPPVSKSGAVNTARFSGRG